ncbi:MAG: hypothetical protein KGN76_08090 [Acidobacteriota bacterium]|nr:hypothetical protein [Acidobacteriota bacterium]
MNTTVSTVSTAPVEPAALDLLQHVQVRIPCPSCGQEYPVSLRQVLLAQQAIEQGCPPRSDTECVPLAYAGLAREGAVRDLERSWRRVEEQARAMGLHMTFARPLLSH